MCGIAGILGSDKQDVETIVAQMTGVQLHRGPDDGGTIVVPFGDQHLALGHRRLSILDLSAAGHQPMVHPGTGDVLIYNGEIYNYVELRRELEQEGCLFHGHSDTEVLLNGLSSKGMAFVRRLKGMFAFAFFCRRTQELVLARDPIGIKPLYLAQTPKAILFASEVRSIMASGCVGDQVDRLGLAGYLAYGAFQSPRTLFQGIRSLHPGKCFRFKPGTGDVREDTYWSYPHIDSRRSDRVELRKEIASTLEAAVKEHLVSDVPIGVFLSSGLDSTIVASLAARHSPGIKTFTVGLENDPSMNESSVAELTAKRLGTEHTTIRITAGDAEQSVSRWLDSMDQPSMDGLNVYVISGVVKKAGITVALSGQGGDELFGGYPGFADIPAIRRRLRFLKFLPASARRALVRTAFALSPEAVRAKAEDMAGTRPEIAALYLQRRRTLSQRRLNMLGFRNELLDVEMRREIKTLPLEDDAVGAISLLESKFYLENMLLRDADVFGMAHSLEIRVPFLDQKMLDLMYRVPGKVRLPHGKADKSLLREAFADCLSPEVLAHEKKGFSLPVSRWMAGELRGRCIEGLAFLKDSGLVDPRGVDDIWFAFERAPGSQMWSRAWELSVLGIYLGQKPKLRQ